MKTTILLVFSILMFVLTVSCILSVLIYYYVHNLKLDTAQVAILTLMGMVGTAGSLLYYDVYTTNKEILKK